MSKQATAGFEYREYEVSRSGREGNWRKKNE